METLRLVVEALIRLVQSEVHPHALLVPPDEMHVIKTPPSIILQGPALTENRQRRSQASQVCKDVEAMTYQRRLVPRMYHLDFEVVLTTANEAQLIDLQERTCQLVLNHPVIAIEDRGGLNLTELVPVGGLRRVNLSNLKQAAGRLRIEDCPISGPVIEEGRLIVDRIFEFHGGLTETHTFTPDTQEDS